VIRGRSRRRSQRRLGADYQTYGSQYRSTIEAVSVRPMAAIDTGRLSRVLAAALLVVLGWGLYTLFTAPIFYVSGVEVRGNAMISAEEVYAASDLDRLSIFWVDSDAVRSRIEALPDIKSAQVRTALPARVIITVEERAPQLVWRSGATTWWIDAEGTVIVPRGMLDGAVVITDVDAGSITPGDVIASEVLESVGALRALLPNLSEMLYSHERGVGFRTGEGWPVFVGDAQDMQAKLTVLKALRKHLLAQHITPALIDVQYPQRAYYR
jgi:cell division protein FtsQ